MKSITLLLREWHSGRDESLDELIHLAYERLRISARRALGEFDLDGTLQATEMVNEFYCHMRSFDYSSCNNSRHFFAISARKLRQLLIERYRQQRAQKRDFGVRSDVDALRDMECGGGTPFDFVVCLDAFDKMSRIDSEAAHLMELRLFWEFSVGEILTILKISESAYYRQWKWAKAWLALYSQDMLSQ